MLHLFYIGAPVKSKQKILNAAMGSDLEKVTSDEREISSAPQEKQN